MTIYIIGNGFDLNHGFKTSYDDYRKYLLIHNPNLIDNYESQDNYLINHHKDRNKSLWSDVEQCLTINYDEFMYDASDTYYPNLMDDNPGWNDIDIDVGVKFGFLSNFTGECFYNWIKNQSSFKPSSLRTDVDTKAYFVSFNYTNTLERDYNIPQNHILHIHGSIDDSSSIQFGSPDNDPDILINDLNRTYESHDFYGAVYENAINSLSSSFCSAYKNIKGNYDKLRRFLIRANEKEINKVFVMGHIIMEIDNPYYIDVIVPLFRDVAWNVYVYSENDRNKAYEFFDTCNIRNGKLIEW